MWKYRSKHKILIPLQDYFALVMEEASTSENTPSYGELNSSRCVGCTEKRQWSEVLDYATWASQFILYTRTQAYINIHTQTDSYMVWCKTLDRYIYTHFLYMARPMMTTTNSIRTGTTTATMIVSRDGPVNERNRKVEFRFACFGAMICHFPLGPNKQSHSRT